MTQRSPATPEPATPQDTPRFSDMPLSPVMLAALEQAEYSEPTQIQAGLIPRALQGIDVLGQARTGTGKTAAFVIPILERLTPHRKGQGPQALVLVPTRELAVQVREEVVKLAHGRKFHCVAIYGGKPIRAQIEKLNRGADVVVGTPGRVIDHLGRGTFNTSDLKIVVLDEADRMLDIGFRPDIEKILHRCPKDRQTLLLSATVPPAVERLAQRYMRNPETQNFSPKDVSVDTIDQYYCTVEEDRKFELLEKLIREQDPKQAIVFCRTKHRTDKIERRLSRRFEHVGCIHGDLGQGARDRVMALFREGKVRVLVATDVVGRGIDVSSISHIINYDIPVFSDDYVHRVGRTGRMGREGVAYTFVTPEEGQELTRIEMRINRLLGKHEVKGFDQGANQGAKPTAPPGSATADPNRAEAEPAPAEPPKPKPTLPGYGRTRRIRRAL